MSSADPPRDRSTGVPPGPDPPDSPALSRPFALLAFDWDGTAVASRHHPAEDLLGRTAPLAELGVWLVVITGTHYENLDRQYFSKLPPEARARHVACVNRGSEVFGFDADGRLETLHRRVATDGENARMDEVAIRIRDELADGGLKTEVIFDRVNRRKLDLIPLPEWSDPPKERIGELLEAVRARLAAAGLEGGIQAIMDRVEEIAGEAGLDLRLTTDVKHIEFGLTDKADSVAYVSGQLAPARDIRPEDILILGDEFGPIDGFEGSDYKTFVLAGATYVSVGREPNGTPEGVLHVGGGPEAFLGLLDRQLRLHRERKSA
jgi:hydroxymethylpyrimidine pyrophosphatase-like HAD family hydrolase